jgi:hypothetical protein
MTSWFNISGTVSAFRLLRDPTLCLPHHTVPTFAHLPVPLSPALASSNVGGDAKRRAPDIRAVVLDKDNCFAVPHSNEIYPACKVCIDRMREWFRRRLICQGQIPGAARRVSWLEVAHSIEYGGNGWRRSWGAGSIARGEY